MTRWILTVFLLVTGMPAALAGQGGMIRVPSVTGSPGMNAAAYRSNDPPGRMFPGRYFEYRAQFALKRNDYAGALDMFVLSGFWGNKVAQYDAALMYYNGLGVPVDRVRGTAWLGIAAEGQDDLAVAALRAAYASLDVDARRAAGALFKELDAKYGDGVAFPRALRQYENEAKMATGSHLGFVGNLTVYETGPGGSALGEAGFSYYRRNERELDALLDRIAGHVRVGSVRAIKVDQSVRGQASGDVLVDPTQGAH
ncbi:MAG: hypothetical protein ABI846_05365 [Rudaea sp.]